ncbi:MAG: flagellar motor switch protein FliG [SAR86 cluster bacterium]|uniref:Flagellar motor switch protein FliG n=1 Tax=SAR86 cluster bacterium TaxID=2030880 RepID=A0A2A5B564_9GAMM|nr:MAG: flagellar motor switch protein FliG [SAR86 cluster bacterium]
MRQRRNNSRKSGPEKAAQLLMVMGEQGAAGVLKLLGTDEVEKIGMEMTNMSEMSTEDVNGVLNNFLEECLTDGSINIEAGKYTKNVLMQALGPEVAENILEKITRGGNTRGLDALKWMEPQLISGIIQNEHPQIQAIVVSYLGAELSGEVLSHMDESAVVELLVRMAEMEDVDPIALEELNNSLEKQVEGVVTKQSTNMGGVKNVASIFNSLDKAFEESLMSKITEQSAPTAARIQEEMFVFEDLKKIPDKDFQLVLREVSTDVLAMALKGADKALEEKVIKNMSSRAADIFMEDMEGLGPVKISEVEAAQKEVLVATKQLADSEKIVLSVDSGAMIG